jgi:hypothetical protein
VEILDLKPRVNPDGKTYGSNAAAWWGFQARVPKVDASDFTAGTFTNTPGSHDEMVTIYELVEEDGKAYAVPSYQFEWPVITDPDGTRRDFIAYPGTCVPHDVHGGTTVSQHQMQLAIEMRVFVTSDSYLQVFATFISHSVRDFVAV